MAKQKSKEDIVSTAKERFKQAMDAESENRSRAVSDIRFVDLGEQWDDRTLNDRRINGRPCIVVNKCAGVVKQISNDARQNKPRIKVRPNDSKADVEIAEIYNGLIRQIENQSDADAAYDTGIDQAIKGGWGYWRVVTDYVSEDVFEQDIFIRRITNQFSVYLDPSSKEADKSDAKWAFVTEVLSKKEFENQYPKADAVSWDQQGEGEGNVEWFTDNGIRVAEYYYLEPIKKTLWQTLTMTPEGNEDYDVIEAGNQEIIEQNGKKFFVTETTYEQPEQPQTPGQPEQPQMEEQPSMMAPQRTVTEIVKEKVANCYQLYWCKLAGGTIIEGPKKQAGKYVPIVCCVGDESWIEGEPIYKSAFYHAKDAQRLYNWARSNAVETLALGPKQPFIGTPAMFEGHEAEWDNAHRNPKMRLTANADNGLLPQRQPLTIGDIGSMQEAQVAADDIKATTGLFDASLGAKGNETSGRAILARQRESDTSTFHFPDNQARAIRFTGRILVDLIPQIYDTERVVRLLGDDGKDGWAYVNKKVADPTAPGGYRVVNDLSVGRYDVTCDVGPGYMTKRLEAADGMVQFMSAAPQTAPILLPRIAKNLDWPDAEEIGRELQQAMTPQPPPPNPKQEMDMMKGQLDIQGKQLVNAQRQQDLAQSGNEQDQRTYAIAQQAMADILRQLGLLQ